MADCTCGCRGDPAVDLEGCADVVVVKKVIGDYTALDNKPSIEGHVLIGDMSIGDLGFAAALEDAVREAQARMEMSESDIDKILNED